MTEGSRRRCAAASTYWSAFPSPAWARSCCSSGGPWGIHFDRVEGASTRNVYGDSRNPWYEPGQWRPLEIEWRETIRTYESVRKGYRPWLHRSLPQVTLLVRRDGDFRAVRYNG